MGSIYDLRIAGYSVAGQKHWIHPEILSLFFESDKAHQSHAPDLPRDEEADEVDEFDGYCCSAIGISERLDLMGFTLTKARVDFAEHLNSDLQEIKQRQSEWRDSNHKVLREAADFEYENKIALLSTLTFDAWTSAMKRIRVEKVDYEFDFDVKKRVFSRTLQPVEALILNEACEDEIPPLGFYCSDLRFLVRAFLETVSPTDLVVLDCTDMVQAGYFGAEEPIAENARLELTSNARATEKLLVLTEGSSDSRILRETLKVIYPHLTECISFLDHDQFSVAGGTGGLMNLLRGFAAAGVSNRVVAVFDNDTAGCVQVDKARGLPLPKNVKIIQLPPLPVADLYPTLGPMGPMEANLNGCAC